MLDTDLIEALEAVYACVPKVACKRRCAAYCGPLYVGAIEQARITLATGKPIGITAGASCDRLTASGECSIYPLRPLICRVFGAVKKLHCKQGCLPDRVMTDEEGYDLMTEVCLLSEMAGLQATLLHTGEVATVARYREEIGR